MPAAIAVLTSDWHFSEKVPACRAETPEEWLRVQEGYFDQMFQIAGHRPVICAGDVFDKWDVPASTINALIRILKLHTHGIYTIPGQHDLPNHSWDQIRRSGYWTLCEAETINSVGGFTTSTCLEDEGLIVYGFPWGTDPRPCPDPPSQHCTRLAIVHKYMWYSRESAFPGASVDGSIANNLGRLHGHDAVIVGDNHRKWSYNLDKVIPTNPAVLNCGTFIRRKADEIDHTPAVGILHDDGTIKIHYLETSGDRFVDAPEKVEAAGLNSAEFLKELLNLADAAIDYREAVKQFMKTNTTKQEVRQFVTRILEDRKNG